MLLNQYIILFSEYEKCTGKYNKIFIHIVFKNNYILPLCNKLSNNIEYGLYYVYIYYSIIYI